LIRNINKICLALIISVGAHASIHAMESMSEFYARTKPHPLKDPLKIEDKKSIVQTTQQKPESKIIDPDNFHAIILPGQNDNGGYSFCGNHIINTPETRYKTISSFFGIDLGQQNCINHFQDQLKKDDKVKGKKIIACGVSQGTATIGNTVSQWPKKKQEKKIGCLVIEAVLGSGNSAILHTVGNVHSWLTYFPFARVLLPLGAKVIFPSYKPWGMQLVKSAEKLSTNIPIIIKHAKQDPQLSINDAREFYCKLSKRENGTGKENIYLMEIDTNWPAHFDTLFYSLNKAKEIAAIQAIYKKHGLPYNETYLKNYLEKHKEETDLTKEYQPDPKIVKERINSSTRRQRCLRNTIDVTTGGLLAFAAAYALPGVKTWVKSWVASWWKQKLA
jgi:hypothetical protein